MYDADLNCCVQNTFAALDLVWCGPLFIMKQTMGGEPVEYKESGICIIIDVAERSVAHLLICFFILKNAT